MRTLFSCLLLLSLWCALAAGVSDLSCNEFTCGNKKILLFAIRANTGKSALIEFDNATSSATHPEEQFAGSNLIPDPFRSYFLDDLPRVIKRMGSKVIVTEMRKENKVVARAIFDVSSDVDDVYSHNWFTASRLIKTEPYWLGNKAQNYVDMAIRGHRYSHYQRTFYIHHSHGLCETDKGLMGIGETINDGCRWVTDGGRPPVLFYSKKPGKYMGGESVVGYADLFLVYLAVAP